MKSVFKFASITTVLQFMERVGDLEEHDVWVAVLVAEHHTLAEAAHAMLFVVTLQTRQALFNRRVLLRLCILCADSVAAERVEANSRRLVCIESEGYDRSAFDVSRG
jgi:hypothetical protein